MSIEELARMSGISSEHVLLESEEPAGRVAEPARIVRQRFEFTNHTLDTETTLTLFDDGRLSVREKRKGRLKGASDTELDLRYVDPLPVRSWRWRRALLRSAGLVACVFAGAALITYFLPVSEPVLFVAASVTALSAAAWTIAAQTERRVAFRTPHGRATVLVLVASFGCLRECRDLSRDLVIAIGEARRHAGRDRQHFLRAEIREHYRLVEIGALSPEACTRAVRRALTHFG